MTRLEQSIRELQRQVRNEIEYINSGGCIHFAYYFSKKLTKLGVDHKIYFTDYEPIYLNYDNYQASSHVMVYIPKIGYIDGYELHKTRKTIGREYYSVRTKISTKKLDNFRNCYCWNPTYDTDQNKKLESLIEKTDYGKRRCVRTK